MNPNKKIFSDLIINGTPQIEAALTAWPEISRKTARNKSSLMMKDPEVMNYIRDNRDGIAKEVDTIINKELVKDVAEKKAGSILTAIRKQQILNEIAEGRATSEKIIIIDGKIKRVKCKPTPQERLKAIEIANRMAGDLVKPKEAAVHKAQEVKKVIIMEDQSEPIKRIEE